MSERQDEGRTENARQITDELREKFCGSLSAYLRGHHPDLYPTQLEVLENILETAEHDNGGYVQLPSGSGKTVVFSELVKATGLKTLVVVPTRQLVAQTVRAFEARGVSPVRRVSPYEREDEGALVSVATYMGVVKHAHTPAARLMLDPAVYDLLVLDEAHHASSPGMKKALSQFKHAYQFGFTASPDYSQYRKLDEVLPNEIYNKSIVEAVELGLVSPFTNLLVFTNSDMSEVGVANGEYETQGLRRAINTPSRNEAIARLYAANFPDKKSFFPCADIEHAKDMAEALRAQGIAAQSIHSKLIPEKRSEILDRYAERSIQALTCVDMLVEGFDDPTVEVVINVAPTLSIIRQLQRSGRALRVDHQNINKHAYIIDCVDRNYRQHPVLFCDQEIAGVSHALSAEGLSEEATITLERLQEYAAAQHIPIAGTDEMAEITASAHMRVRASGLRTSHTDLVAKLNLKQPALNWGQDAACNQFGQAFVDQVFYPERESPNGGVTAVAKYICGRCAVIDDCLAFSLETPDQAGTRAGLTANQRRGALALLRSGVDPLDVNKHIEQVQSAGIQRAKRLYRERGLGF